MPKNQTPSSSAMPPAPATRDHATTAVPHQRIAFFRKDSGDGVGSNEQSPLLAPIATTSGADYDDDHRQLRASTPSSDGWTGTKEESKSGWYLFLLGLVGIGLQMGWSVQMSSGSPYLLSLGLTKSMLALVWIAGPLAGVVAQPYIGIRSDRSKSKWGRRRPYIIGGATGSIASLFALAWARQIVSGVLAIFGLDPKSNGVRVSIMLFAVFFVYLLDASMNVMEAGMRSFVVDCAPTHQQDTANAWVSRMCGVGNIIGMLCGFLDLPKLFPFLGDTQFQALSSIACLSIAITVSISCYSISERDPTLEDDVDTEKSVLALFEALYRAFFRLPPQILKVCTAQFMAWMGWFPFLFYITTYIGGIYVEPFFQENPNMSDDEINEIWDRATRIGTLAMLFFAIITFTASVLLPFIVASPSTDANDIKSPITLDTPTSPTSFSRPDFDVKLTLYSTSYSTSFLSRLQTTISDALSLLRIQSLTLRRAWVCSHILFTACMWLTFIVRSVWVATILVGLVGLSWAVTQWAPFALISAEISKRDDIRRDLLRRGLLRPSRHTMADGGLLVASPGDEDDSADRAGVVLGIHNIAVSLPQLIATLISSVIFNFLQKPRGSSGDESVVWCLRLGGVCALAAAYLTLRVNEENADLQPAAVRDARSTGAGSV